MHIVIVSAVFPPEPAVSAQTSAQIASELIRRHHIVQVVTTFPNRPSGRLYPGYARRLYKRERRAGGLTLTRCYSILAPESSVLRRFMENISFGITSSLATLGMPRPDVIYSNSWPIFASGLLFLVAKIRRIPLVISVQDVYPESLAVQGRLQKRHLGVRWMRWVDGVIARGANHVIVISERFADIYHNDRRVPEERLSVIPNWAAANLIDLDVDTAAFRRANHMGDDEFMVVYGGNVGVAAGVETVIEAMGQLADLERLRFVIAGEGSRLASCRDLAEHLSEDRVIIHSPWLLDETSSVLRAADVLVLPTRGSQSTASVPSKLISYMLAARPILALAMPQSDIARIIEESGCGWVIAPDQPALLAAQLRTVVTLDPIERDRRGQAGRRYALQNLTSEVCLPRVISILEKTHAPGEFNEHES